MTLRDIQPEAVQLADYSVSEFLIDHTTLAFRLEEGVTEVRAKHMIRRNPAAQPSRELRLDGEDLELLSISIDGVALTDNEYLCEDHALVIHDVNESFELELVTRIRPEENTALEGLYKSGGMYCTQCEAQGFRKISYFLDRPDVLCRYTTSIEADNERYPVMLSNGNCIREERLENGRKRVTWDDPFPKPSYLFALVAGDLAVITDTFVTCSGREVALLIYSEPHNIDQCHYAMGALKRAMKWDEKVYGREYDLDIFMLVAVDDFNMGAMENKGLNIFNTSCVLATPDTATDEIYERVESVVAHEYFHNWSGNRVTCRDWFQLSLKEGFTVFRDSQFTSDMHSQTLKRIEDVYFLRTVQFSEDASPMAHPIRPQSYIEISNFYTATVYSKGAEVVGMIRTMLGPENFRKGSDLYFTRHDGQAVTTEDFVTAMEDASGLDLTQFRVWYQQAGTPTVTVTKKQSGDCLTLSFSQTNAAVPSEPLHIPLKLGLIDAAGQELLLQEGVELESESETGDVGHDGSIVFHLKQSAAELRVRHCPPEAVLSLLRGFSAPVRLNYQRSDEELAFLALHDSDGFCRWDAVQTLYAQAIENSDGGTSAPSDSTKGLLELVAQLIEHALRAADDGEAKSLFAAMLTLPGESYLHERAEIIDVQGLHDKRTALANEIAETLQSQWLALYEANTLAVPYSPDGVSAARRRLKNMALRYLARASTSDGQTRSHQLLRQQLSQADNLTERLSALDCIVADASFPHAERRKLLAEFYERWRLQKLVVDQWFSVQALAPGCGGLERVLELERHPAFNALNPNRARSLYGTFCGRNHVNFHRLDGAGYEFLADRVCSIDRQNPQLASRLIKPLIGWRRFSPVQRRHMRKALEGILKQQALSADVYEIVVKSLQ